MATFPRCTTHFPRFKTATLLLWALLPVAFSGTLHAEDQYRAVFADDLARVVVEACFDGAAPAHLYRHRHAGAFAGKVLINGSAMPATADGSRIELPSLPADSCVEWQVDLAQAAAAGDDRLAMRLDLPMHESTAARQAASPGEVPDSPGGSPPEEVSDLLAGPRMHLAPPPDDILQPLAGSPPSDAPAGSRTAKRRSMPSAAPQQEQPKNAPDHGYLTSGSLWFWRDNDRRPVRMVVELPHGVALSTPWADAGEQDGHRVYRPALTPAGWSSRIAVGRFPLEQLAVPGTALRLAIVGAVSPQQREVLGDWIAETARSVALVHGQFPQPLPQVLVVPIGPRSEPVPWAHVLRGGGVAVEFFVDEASTPEQLLADWTATHEFSHLLLPYVSSRDRWFSEGLASYYQNVLRARAGHLTEQEAWQKLHSGFERGRAATQPGQDLASATRSGWRSVMRIYWSGAAMMLMADAQLRQFSGGRQSLDTALGALQHCCLDSSRTWCARELFAELDQLTGYSVFSDLYRAHVPDTAFPDVSDVYEQLGLSTRGERVRIEPDAPWSRIRYFIMNEPSATSSRGAFP